MKKTCILFITPLPPPVHGSSMVSQYLKDSKLIQEEFNCDFVNLSTSRRMDEIGKRSFIKIFRFICSYFIVFLKLLTHRYSLCYLAITCHGVGFLKDAPFVLLCKLFRRKILIHQHNKGMSYDLKRWPYKWLFPLVYRNTKVMLLSWYLYKDISEVVNQDQIVICPNGIPEITDITTIKSHNTVPRILFLSNLIKSKGVYLLLDACKILKERGYSFMCDFVGGESKEITRIDFEKAICDRGLEKNVLYHGPKYGPEKKYFWTLADIFVFPTYYGNECFPLVLLEAMQWKLPIVSTNEGGIPDIIQDNENGFICERKDVNSLVEAIEKLLLNKDLRYNMGIKGNEIYKCKFTLDKFEERMKELLSLNILINIKKEA